MLPEFLQIAPRLFMLAILAFLLLRACISDIRRYKIPNRICLMIAVAAPAYWISCAHGFNSALLNITVNQLLIAVCAFGFFFLPFWWGKMGAGDVKMITAISLWTPPYALLQWLLIMSIVGIGLEIIRLVAKYGFDRKRGFFRVRYGVAIALGGMVFIGEPFLKTFSG
jgi:prepilin peptidase CpaA